MNKNPKAKLIFNQSTILSTISNLSSTQKHCQI